MGKKKIQLNANTVISMTSRFWNKEQICSALQVSAEGFDAWLRREFQMTWMDFKRKHVTYGRMKFQDLAIQKANSGYWPAIEKLCDVYVWPDHKQKVQLSGDESAPIVTKAVNNYDALTVEELETLQAITDKLSQ